MIIRAKNIILVSAILLGIGYALIPNSNAQITRTYPLACHVSDEMRVTIVGSAETRKVQFTFQKASRGFDFDRRNLAPGECAWFDRSVSRAEPGRAVYTTSGQLNVSFDPRSASNVAIHTSDVVSRTLIRGLMRGDGYFVMNVENTNDGVFKIHGVSEEL